MDDIMIDTISRIIKERDAAIADAKYLRQKLAEAHDDSVDAARLERDFALDKLDTAMEDLAMAREDLDEARQDLDEARQDLDDVCKDLSDTRKDLRDSEDEVFALSRMLRRADREIEHLALDLREADRDIRIMGGRSSFVVSETDTPRNSSVTDLTDSESDVSDKDKPAKKRLRVLVDSDED